jgi:cytoskeletal protein CcmA (bactofilin family)
MFRRPNEKPQPVTEPVERVDSVLGPGIAWQGAISGSGGVRIDGAFDGDIHLRGLVVIGEQGRVTCKQIRAATVVVAGEHLDLGLTQAEEPSAAPTVKR